MVAPLVAVPTVTEAQTVSNPSTAPDCMNNTAFYNPTLPPSINLPPGFTASVFAKNLNMPTGIAFLGNSSSFQVFVLESGHGLPSVCNDEMAWPGGPFDINNPFTPDILVFNQKRRSADPWANRHPPEAGSSPRAGGRYCVRQWPLRRAAVCDRFQSINPSTQWAKQQLAHQHREPDDRGGHSVHHQPADG
jgi:hypothetical protein